MNRGEKASLSMIHRRVYWRRMQAPCRNRPSISRHTSKSSLLMAAIAGQVMPVQRAQAQRTGRTPPLHQSRCMRLLKALRRPTLRCSSTSALILSKYGERVRLAQKKIRPRQHRSTSPHWQHLGRLKHPLRLRPSPPARRLSLQNHTSTRRKRR